ncbi:ATPase [Saccharobesus litoralis]|uniref:ATPase n=1 Tax=Saccharobesus litoralis TaxID=2172099 RepID=A0A2S0VV41_9ALTE|nr:BadF/BadG/BcrA/BcrD ATPase family protein [Saccharobesus litoralis]AWB68065.1 ATPase [Saccharobesus litoralis]
MADQKYIIGVDGGGTKCRARLYCTVQGFLGTGLAGPANPARDFDSAMQSVIDACQAAIQNANLPQLKLDQVHVGMGLAGVNLASVKQKVLAWQHPFKSRFVTTDLHIACIGANDNHEGAVIIVGTGSCGLVVKDNEFSQLGGHGFPVGDYGGGAWLGFEAIRYALRAMDNLAPSSSMITRILSYLNCSNANDVAEIMLNARPADFARLAPLVFDAAEDGDEAARSIIQTGAEQISELARQLLAKHPSRLSMIGGVSERIKSWLADDVAKHIQTAVYQPDYGAVFFTLNQFKN